MDNPKEPGPGRPCCAPRKMGIAAKAGIVAALVVMIAAVIWAKNMRHGASAANGPDKPAAAALPRLVDLGATQCIPCKMMTPVLDELKKEYAGKLDVVFIDVWANAEAGKPYGYRSIPTQIFFDANGKELFRHEGFFAKADILAKWKELGIDLPASKRGES